MFRITNLLLISVIVLALSGCAVKPLPPHNVAGLNMVTCKPENVSVSRDINKIRQKCGDREVEYGFNYTPPPKNIIDKSLAIIGEGARIAAPVIIAQEVAKK